MPFISPDLVKQIGKANKPSLLRQAGSFIKKNPVESLAAANAAVGLVSRFGKSREQQLLQEVLDEQLGFRSELARHSKGQFTPSDIRRIREANNSRLNAVAGDVAQRGLGTSGAGAQVLAEAQQLPFLHTQAAATQVLAGANEAAFNMARAMEGSDSFKEDFAKVVGTLTELHGMGDDAKDDSVMAEMFEWLKEQWSMLNEPVEPSEPSEE